MYNPAKPTKGEILRLIKSTWKSPYLKIQENTYAIFEKKFKYQKEVDHTDGIGTKGYYHWKKRTFQNAVIDALAMNLNDLALVGATAYKLQNHIVLPRDDNKAVLKIVSELVRECKKRKIAITGGETSIHNNTDGLDISLTVSGYIKKSFKNSFREGDLLIGLKSNGLHSNGLTKVRELFKNKVLTEFTAPTAIYSELIMKVINKYPVHGMMHITGGAFTKLKSLLHGTDAIINREHKINSQKIFFNIYNKGVSDKDMYKTFNCGIGFILSVPEKDAEAIAKYLKGSIIGEVVGGTGKVRIQSKFSNKEITL